MKLRRRDRPSAGWRPHLPLIRCACWEGEQKVLVSMKKATRRCCPSVMAREMAPQKTRRHRGQHPQPSSSNHRHRSEATAALAAALAAATVTGPRSIMSSATALRTRQWGRAQRYPKHVGAPGTMATDPITISTAPREFETQLRRVAGRNDPLLRKQQRRRRTCQI